MATYNGERFLGDQLASFANQTHPPAELVVCDDGSTDSTLAILDAFSKTASFPVRVERNNSRLGISDNFLKAASLCSEPLIAFSDQDDVWAPEKLEVVKTAFDTSRDVLLVAHRARIVDENLLPVGHDLHVPDVRRRTVVPVMGRSFWSYPYGFTISFRSRLTRDYSPAERPIWSHDRWIYVLAMALGKTVLLPEVLADYRRHGANASDLHAPPPLSREGVRASASAGYALEIQLVDAVAGYFRERSSAASPDAMRLAEAASCYASIARHLRRRASLVDSAANTSRSLAAFWSLLAHFGYRNNRHGGLGWRAGIKDLARLFLR